MTESSRASSTSIQIFLKTDIFFSPFFVFRFFFFERRQGHSQTSRGGNPEIGQNVRC